MRRSRRTKPNITWQKEDFNIYIVNNNVGLGVFANRTFTKGDFLLPYEGNICMEEPSAEDDTFVFEYTHGGKTYWIDASYDDGSLGRLLNDDFDRPNCVAKVFVDEENPRIGFFALREIDVGEELRYSYGGQRSTYPWRSKIASARAQKRAAADGLIALEDLSFCGLNKKIFKFGRENEAVAVASSHGQTSTPDCNVTDETNEAQSSSREAQNRIKTPEAPYQETWISPFPTAPPSTSATNLLQLNNEQSDPPVDNPDSENGAILAPIITSYGPILTVVCDETDETNEAQSSSREAQNRIKTPEAPCQETWISPFPTAPPSTSATNLLQLNNEQSDPPVNNPDSENRAILAPVIASYGPILPVVCGETDETHEAQSSSREAQNRIKTPEAPYQETWISPFPTAPPSTSATNLLQLNNEQPDPPVNNPRLDDANVLSVDKVDGMLSRKSDYPIKLITATKTIIQQENHSENEIRPVQRKAVTGALKTSHDPTLLSGCGLMEEEHIVLSSSKENQGIIGSFENLSLIQPTNNTSLFPGLLENEPQSSKPLSFNGLRPRAGISVTSPLSEEQDEEEVVYASDSEYNPESEVVSESDCSSPGSDVYPPLIIKPANDIQQETVTSSTDYAKIQVLQTNNNNGRKYDKISYCLYCGAGQSKLSRHLPTVHKDEKEVIQYSLLENVAERKTMMMKLRNLGNHKHNTEVLRNQYGDLIVVYRPDGYTTSDSYVPCEHCLGYYVSHDLWKHIRRCRLAPEDKVKNARVVQRCRLLLPVPRGNSIGLRSVLDTMKSDDIGRIVKGDPLILQLGEKLFLKNGHDKEQFSYIRNTLREVARLLLELRNEAQTPELDLKVFIDPLLFQKVVEAARIVAGFDQSTHIFRTPSLALKIGHSIKKCARLLERNGLEQQDAGLVEKARNFFLLCEMSWTEEVSTHALRTLSEAHRNKVKFIPLVNDVKLLTLHLKKVATDAFNKLSVNGTDTEAWRDLNEASLTQIMQFNRRRQGEISKAKIEDYKKEHSAMQEDLQEILSPLEQKLCESFHRLELVGKRGRTVPMLLTEEMRRWIDLLLANREKVGVHPENPFLFPRCYYGSLGHIRGCDTLRDASEMCGAKYPQLLRSTKLRKQIATLSQVLNLRDNELDILANFMGHDIRVHREYYRLPEETLQVAKISKLLLSLENGQFSKNHGKSLDEITVDVDEDLDVQMDECESDIEEEMEESIDFTSKTDNGAALGVSGHSTKKRPWTESEKAAVLRHFEKHILLKKVPVKKEVMDCCSKEPILINRTWKNIKDFVRNKTRVRKPKQGF